MARRGRRVGIALAVIFVLLIGLLIGVDRVGAWAAERTLADKVSQQMDQMNATSQEPEVTVNGFPFLTQVLDGKYKEIQVRLRDVSANGITVPDLDVRAKGVNAEMNTLMSGDGSITADQVDGTATIGYESVRALINRPGLELSDENGKLKLRLPLEVLSQKVVAIAVADVSAANNKVKVSVTDIRPEGAQLIPAAQRLLDAYKKNLSIELALPPLPFRLQVQGVQVKPDGLAVSATARSVSLSS